MTSGGDNDKQENGMNNIPHKVAALDALRRLRMLADDMQHRGRAALSLAEMQLQEEVAVSGSGSRKALADALGKAATRVTNLLAPDTPFEFYGPIADVLEPIAAALREFGHHDEADQLAGAA
jgi:hypothetical protein